MRWQHAETQRRKTEDSKWLPKLNQSANQWLCSVSKLLPEPPLRQLWYESLSSTESISLMFPSKSGPWEIRMSSSRSVPYFFNQDTKKSVWETPDGLTREQIDSLPGAEYLSRPAQVRASHLLVKHAGSRNPSSWKEVHCDVPTSVPALIPIVST